MTTQTVKREQLESWLEALEDANKFSIEWLGEDAYRNEITAIKEVLAQPAVPQGHKQEPASTIRISREGSTRTIENHFADRVRDWPDGEYKLYTTPPQQPKEPEHDINSAVTVVYVYRQADGNTQVIAPDTNNEELVTDILYEALQAMTTGHQLEKH